MKTFLACFISALLPLAAFSQGAYRRNPVTTNQFMNLPQDGWSPIWNTVAGRWSNGVPPSATNASAYIASLSGLGSNVNIKALEGTSRALLVNTNVLVVTNGNVGVGTDAPDTKLRVVGEFLVTGGDITAHTGANFRDDAFAGDKVLITGVGPNAAIEEGSVTVNELLSFNNKIANLNGLGTNLTVSGPLTAADNLLATYLTRDRRAILGNDSSLTNAYKHYFYDTNSAPTLSNKVANVSAGDTVEFGEGVFNIGPQTIRVPVGARLIGQGIDKTIISGTVGADTNAIVLLSSTNIIEDLTVEAGNRTAYLQYPMGLSSGLGHRAATNITLRRVKLDGESDGLFIVHSNYCSGWIEDCNFISKFDSCNLLGNLSTGTPWPGQDWTIINTRLIADVAGATEPASLANNGATPLKVAHGRVTLLQCNVVATNGDTTACATSFGDTNLFIIVGGRWESAGTNISRVLTESTGNSTFDVTGTSINHSNVSSLVNLVLWRQYEASHLSAGGIKFTGGQTANSVLGLNSTTNVVPLALSGLTFHASGNVLSNSAAAGAGTPGGFSGSVQFNEGGAFAGTNRFTYDRTNEVLSLVGSSAGSVRLYDSDSSHSVNLIGNATLTSNLNLTFPAAMSNGVLTVVSVNDSNFTVAVVPSFTVGISTPTSTLLRGTNHWFDGGLSSFYTNTFVSNIGGVTNILGTNLIDGAITRLEFEVQPGVSVGFPGVSAAQWGGAVPFFATNSGLFNIVEVTRHGAVTNYRHSVVGYEFAAGSNVTFATNHVTRVISFASTGGSQTPLTADVNGAGNDITNLFALGVGVTVPVATQNPSIVIGGTNSAGSATAWELATSNAVFRLFSPIAPTTSPPLTLTTNGSLTLAGGGDLTSSGSVYAGATAAIGWAGARSVMNSSASGIITMWSAGQSDFTRLTFGGTTAAFPALGRTNGHLKVFGGNGLFGSAGTNAMYIDGGTYYVSNTIIPSVTQLLGAGGYWVGNSNGFLVTVYTLDGTTTAMKVLAP